MKIYTKSGDDGSTGLFGGARVSKAHARLECYGTIDELNALLGLAGASAETVGPPELLPLLREIQAELLVIGSHLATPADAVHRDKLPPLDPRMSERLERQIDLAEGQLQPLRQFILPGGGAVAATLHVARTVCRRAERRLVALAEAEAIERDILIYINRLSDWLFVHARWANARSGVADVPWVKPEQGATAEAKR